MTVRFRSSGGTTTATVRNPEFGNRDIRAVRQSVGETTGSRLYVYDWGVTDRSIEMAFKNLTYDEKNDLEGFFDFVAEGQFNAFDFDGHPYDGPLRCGAQDDDCDVIQCGSSIGGIIIVAGMEALQRECLENVRFTHSEIGFDEIHQESLWDTQVSIIKRGA